MIVNILIGGLKGNDRKDFSSENNDSTPTYDTKL